MTNNRLDRMLKPLSEKSVQAYLGQGLHVLGLLGWLLPQTGAAHIFVSSFSTSEAFLNGFVRLREKRLVRKSMILLDQRAARKTERLKELMKGAFDNVFLGQNHSKIILAAGERMKVAVVTSQNQTYGNRTESTIITTDGSVFNVLMKQYEDTVATGAVELDLENGKGIITESGTAGAPAAYPEPDFRPFGVEW